MEELKKMTVLIIVFATMFYFLLKATRTGETKYYVMSVIVPQILGIIFLIILRIWKS